MIEGTDLQLTISSVGFFLAMMPALWNSRKGQTSVTLWTSIPTAVLLFNTSIALLLLDQTMGAYTTLAVAGCWLWLAMKRHWPESGT